MELIKALQRTCSFRLSQGAKKERLLTMSDQEENGTHEMYVKSPSILFLVKT